MARRICTVISGLTLVVLATAPAAMAAATATDEYSLDLLGARSNVNAPTGPIGGGNEPPRDALQEGVAGENLTTPSPLASVSMLVGGAPVMIAIAFAGLACAAAVRTRRSRT